MARPWKPIAGSSVKFVLVGLLAGGAAVALHGAALWQPTLLDDDFPILLGSWTWHAAWANLWVPANEHAMPLGRVSNWLLVQIAGRPTLLPAVTALQGPLAVLLGMGLIYLFVSRECGERLVGLLALILFGVSTQYREAVTWFAASFAVLTLDTLLLALLAAQEWRRAGLRRYLVLCVLGTALAPGWFASGVLAGPLCALYLLFPERRAGGVPIPRSLVALSPLLGTLLFLAMSLPRNADRILHAEHYGSKDALQAFNPWVGLMSTGRSLVDNVLVGTVGIPGVVCPAGLVPVVLIGMIAAGVWWWRRAAQRRLLVLGLGFILASYLLMYSARAEWSYEEQMAGWSRYNLLPHVGLVFFICGGLSHRSELAAAICGAPFRNAVLLIGILFASQLPRGLGHFNNPQQMADLREIEIIDERCRACHLDAATARAVLPPHPVWASNAQVSRWDFLRGSPDPIPFSPEEARRCLADR